MKNAREAGKNVAEEIARAGGLDAGVSREVGKKLGVPEAEVYGVGTFYTLISDRPKTLRVCQGLTCRLFGAQEILDGARASGLDAVGCSCLAACDTPVAALRHDRETVAPISDVPQQDRGLAWLMGLPLRHLTARSQPGEALEADRCAIGLSLPQDFSATALRRAEEIGPDAVIAEITASGLQGRGGAAFPAGIKWKSVCAQPEGERYVVLNADEGEPGTFKDREVLLRRPDLVVEGLAIAARVIGAREIYCYLRGEFVHPRLALERAIERFKSEGHLEALTFHLHRGHGAYICGEETALLESLEGKRGMPRYKPPFPTEKGLWGKPTLIHNVETIACIPAIVRRGGAWFRALGRTEPGTKLYCVSGHVGRPGVYELPLGVTLDELVAVAGGYVGEPKAFSPGGASSGFLPARERNRPLDYHSLAEVGTTLGSAGVVVLDETVDLRRAALTQLEFFRAESCGECAPCRLGTRFLAEAMTRLLDGGGKKALDPLEEIAWEMREGSICGLGQTAFLPLTSALRWFPEEFSR